MYYHIIRVEIRCLALYHYIYFCHPIAVHEPDCFFVKMVQTHSMLYLRLLPDLLDIDFFLHTLDCISSFLSPRISLLYLFLLRTFFGDMMLCCLQDPLNPWLFFLYLFFYIYDRHLLLIFFLSLLLLSSGMPGPGEKNPFKRTNLVDLSLLLLPNIEHLLLINPSSVSLTALRGDTKWLSKFCVTQHTLTRLLNSCYASSHAFA